MHEFNEDDWNIKKVPRRNSKEFQKLNFSYPGYMVTESNNKILVKKNSHETNQSRLKLENGTLYANDNGEFGGQLFFEFKDGEKKIIKKGNFKYFIQTDESIFVMEGLAHLCSDYGSIYQLEQKKNGWIYKKIIDLKSSPLAYFLENVESLFIVTHSELLKVNLNNGSKKILLDNMFWSILYPNSIVKYKNSFLIGMRGGIVRYYIEKNKYDWLRQKRNQ